MTDARSGGGPWRDRTIVVTGGTSGIGRQFAIHFAAEGAKVIACGRNDMALRKLQTEHPTIETVQCDMPAVIQGKPSALGTDAQCFEPKGWLALRLYRWEVPVVHVAATTADQN